MKKFSLHAILAVLLCVAASFPVSARQFRFGVKAGVNINKMHYNKALDDTFDPKNRAGFTAGVMTEFQVPLIGLCFDASLMFTRLYADNQKQASLNQSFFELPINLKYKFSFPAVSQIIAPYIYTGPSFAFRVSGNDNWLKTRTFQPSWNVGIGLELVRHLQIGAGYSFGINNIYKAIGNDVLGGNSVDNIKIRNNYWSVTAAVLF